MDTTRRLILWAGLAASTAGCAASAAAQCVDLDDLSSGQKSLRTSLGFRMASEDPKRHCSGCSFFTADGAGCGKCGLLNGPVPADGRCDSWAAKK